ncbi:MAG: D-alanyl-D-alanine carboxypeptidase family protein [Candidatus Saccharibacteria bacterium]
MKKLCIIIGLAVMLVLNQIVPKAANASEPYLESRAYAMVDADIGQFLAGKNTQKPLPPASTTKIMTAIIALDYLKYDDWADVSAKAAKTPPSAIGLRSGERMRVRDLVTAALMCSANDACVVLAERVAGSEQLFAHLMNKKAAALGAIDTNFENSNGLPAKGHVSSCRDLVRFSICALQNDIFAQTVAKTEDHIQHPGYPKGLQISNTNRLLALYPGCQGIKTGTTDAAGKCLVGYAIRNNRKLITVVLNSPDRYYESKSLMNYGFNEFKKEKIVDASEAFKTLRTLNGIPAKMPIFPGRDVTILTPKEGLPRLEKKVVLEYCPPAPIKKGDKLGRLEVYYNGEFVETTELIAGNDAKAEPRGVWRLFRLFYRE